MNTKQSNFSRPYVPPLEPKGENTLHAARCNLIRAEANLEVLVSSLKGFERLAALRALAEVKAAKLLLLW